MQRSRRHVALFLGGRVCIYSLRKRLAMDATRQAVGRRLHRRVARRRVARRVCHR